MRLRTSTILICGLLVVSARAAWARKWTDKTGKYSVEAELVEVKDAKAWLRRADGKVIAVPLGKLSKADREYLESLGRRGGGEGLSVAKPKAKGAPGSPQASTPAPPKDLDGRKAHSGFIKSIAFSPDGKTLASASADKTIVLWDLNEGLPRATLEGHQDAVLSVAFSPDGKMLASGSQDHTVKLWDPQTDRELATLEGHEAVVYSVVFFPDGEKLASGGSDGIRIWNVKTGQTEASFGKRASRVAVSPDGKKLASGGYQEISIWDAATGERLARATRHEHHVFAVAFSPDGKTLASASYDRTVKLSDAQTLDERATLRGQLDQVFGLAYSPDGQTLASSGGKTVRLWDPETGQQKAVFEGHTSWVRSVAFSPDGTILASAGRDRQIKFWDPGIVPRPSPAESTSPTTADPRQRAILWSMPQVLQNAHATTKTRD